MRLWGLFQFGRDSMFYCRTEFSVDRQPGEKRKMHVFCSRLLVHGRTRFLWSPHLPGVGEIFLVILPTGQHVIKWLDVSEQLKYHNKKQLIKLNHFFPDPTSYFRVHQMEVDDSGISILEICIWNTVWPLQTCACLWLCGIWLLEIFNFPVVS